MKLFASLRRTAMMLITSASLAFAGSGILIVETQRPVSGAGASTTTKVHIESNRIFILTDAGGERQGVMFLGDSGVLRMMDYAKKTYREMTKEDFERMGSQVNDAMAQARKVMEERMKDMPPEQRAMVEKMMQQRMGAAPVPAPKPAKTVYSKIASGQTVGQWTCDQYEGLRGGEKSWDVCAADWSQLDVSPDDFQVFQQMAELAQSISPQGAQDLFEVGAKDWQQRQGYPGVPVRRVAYRDGQPHQEHLLTEVTRQDFADSLFEVPAGFQKVAAVPAMQMPK